MNMKAKILSLFFVLWVISSYGQSFTPEVYASAGNFDSIGTTGITFNWTIGEIITETLDNTNTIFTQGFEQSYWIGISSYESPVNWEVYPNPATDYLYLVSENKNHCHYLVELFDISGKLLYSNTLEDIYICEKINMRNYKTSVYFVRITSPEKDFTRSFVIVKE